jgi:pimeloyl-ACP methyl ester carboxylesterase
MIRSALVRLKGPTMDIRPIRIDIAPDQLDDLRERLDRTRLPDELPDVGDAQGIRLARVRALVERWRDGFDWRAVEARLNALPQYTTTIDGASVYFIHVRSQREDALPLILTHGWPGSVLEFLDAIEPLARDFHIVIPSIPGFGFSGPTTDSGWSSARVARAWAELMRGLGHERYGAQGGDMGAIVAPELGRAAPDNVVGVHVNAASVGFIPFGEVDPEPLTEAERGRLKLIAEFTTDGFGYNSIQSTRPQTLAYGLTDSPAGQLAWIAEKFDAWSHEPIPDDTILAHATLYWLTATAASSARMYYENWHSWGQSERSPVPTAVAVFKGDPPIRAYAEPGNTIARWTEFDRGGHFAALEAPDLLVEDVRAFFSALH